MTRYVEFHLGRTIALSALSELLTQISIDRFQGFIRVNEAGEGRFVLSLPRPDAADMALFSLIRENPSQLYAERSVGYVGDWALEVYSGEIASRTGALIATDQEEMLHTAPIMVCPTFADWLLRDPNHRNVAEEMYARYAPAIPLALRGVVTFKERDRI